jgi:2-desacetyl-2-hydroxyethyl bacteriochlorophyllide A dehydrogenase
MKTHALFYPKANQYAVTELSLPEPDADDMGVRTLVSAISPGTERWILRGKHLGTRFPCAPGYHRIGIVESVGANVTDFRVGDIVYGSGNRWKEEEIHTMWGAHVGYSVSRPAGYAFLGVGSPDNFGLETQSFAVLVAVAGRGVRFLEIKPHEDVLIIGAGVIGTSAAQLASLNQGRPVLLEKDPARRTLVGGLGYPVLGADDPDFESKIKTAAPDGFDVVYDSAGDASTIDAMVQRMKSGGRLLLQAQYFDKEACAIDLDAIKIREITIKTTVGYDHQDFEEALAQIRTRSVRIAPLITHRFNAPDDLLQGYELLDTGSPANLGIVFQWGPSREATFA